MALLVLTLACDAPEREAPHPLLHDAAVPDEVVDEDGDGSYAGTDCDDGDPTSHPDGTEVCDGRDNDCDGEADDSAEGRATWYEDLDGDGFGYSPHSVYACVAPAGYVAANGDCDDDDPARYPGAADVPADGVDQDCDGDDPLVACPDAVRVENSFIVSGADAADEAYALCRRGPVRLEGSLNILDTPFTDLSALACVCEVGNLIIERNAVLESLHGLEGLVEVNDRAIYGYVTIDRNPALASIDALANVRDIESLTLDHNALTSLEGLRGVRLSASVQIRGEHGLVSLDGLVIPSDTTLLLTACNSLVSLQGIAVSSRLGAIRVHANKSLASLAGLEALTAAYAIEVTTNPALPDLAGLEHLLSVDDDVRIQSNRTLLDVSALHGLASIGADLHVRENAALPSADAEALRDAVGNIGGTADVSRNGP